MNRREFLGDAGLASAAALLGAAEASPVKRKPLNVVLIMADDLGAAELGCYGNAKHKTPHLDALARGGTRFETCWATPLCSPSRVEIMTGRYATHTGWWNFIGRPGSPPRNSPQYDIGTSQVTFADVLKARGYATALAGKWQLPKQLPTLVRDCGFDEYMIWMWLHKMPPGVEYTSGWQVKGRVPSRFWHPGIFRNGEYVATKPDDYAPDLFTDFLIDFIRRHKDKPFLAYYPACLTHTPWAPTPDLGRPGKKTRGGLRHNVEYLDHLVGRIVGALDELGLRERTVVLFTGDNGTGGAGKGTVTERGVRVPMIAHCPGVVEAGAVSDALVDFSDVLPTVADLAGAPLPKGRAIDGHSFAPILRGERATGRDWIFSYLRDRRMLRDRRWLLEGNGRLYDCGHRRDGKGYSDVSESTAPEVAAARARFAKILEGLPAPKDIPPRRPRKKRKKEKKQ